MNYCKYCGVEFDDEITHCPLCGLVAGEEPPREKEPEKIHTGYRDKIVNEIRSLTVLQRRKLLWEISGIILGSGILVTLLINFIIDTSISWARYTVVISAIAFTNISFLTFWRNRSLLMTLSSLLSLTILLILIDMISSDIDWGIKLGIPVLISLYVLSFIVYLLIRISNQRGFNILAVVFIAIGTFLVCTECFISLYFYDRITLSWSLIAGSSMIPISAILFYMHYKLKKGIELKRFFHI